MLEVLKDIVAINGETIVVMDNLREQFPEKFPAEAGGQMDYKWFESEIRPHNFVYVRLDKNSLSFTLQKGEKHQVGKNGCELVDVIGVVKHILELVSSKAPNENQAEAITKLEESIMWLEKGE